jgi:hypothetical protein
METSKNKFWRSDFVKRSPLGLCRKPVAKVNKKSVKQADLSKNHL